ncbi:MAG: fumarylacetoacetate hydrolase family protein [Sedimenticola sp.]|nr:fumarylacetoacetate hydrolase family protein [Sedimenticola sp.]
MNRILFREQPVTPSKVVCVGRNYVAHAKELNNEVPTSPVIFIKPNSAISGELQAGTDEPLHYEGEIALLIMDGVIAGVAFGLDLTRRELQSTLKQKGLPWERAKGFDGSAVFSDFVALDDPLESLRLQLDINEQRVQEGGCGEMIFKPAFLIEAIGHDFTLEDGDIIMTGTPNGVGAFQRGDRFLGQVLAGDRLLVSRQWTAR